MKTLGLLTSSLLTLAAIYFLLLFQFAQPTIGGSTQDQKENPTQDQAIEVTTGSPVRLIIPSIKVDAKIQTVGINPEGDMENPSNVIDVGWFMFGPRPGNRGSAVISGHYNGEFGEVGVFYNLSKLKPGDKIYIQDDTGANITFIVQKNQTYDPGYAEEVFSSNDNAHLNLITCDGVWDSKSNSYSKRLVVFADKTK